MERKVILENNSTQNRNIFKADQEGIYCSMERYADSKARERFNRKPYVCCDCGTKQEMTAFGHLGKGIEDE